MKILVSACLIGVNCNYKGKNKFNEFIVNLKKEHFLIPVCPEQLGGLSTPRKPSEINKDNKKIYSILGLDVTENFNMGARETLNLANLYDIDFAILKSDSPSCSNKFVHDGTFSNNLVLGLGRTAEILISYGITIFNELQIEEILEFIKKNGNIKQKII